MMEGIKIFRRSRIIGIPLDLLSTLKVTKHYCQTQIKLKPNKKFPPPLWKSMKNGSSFFMQDYFEHKIIKTEILCKLFAVNNWAQKIVLSLTTNLKKNLQNTQTHTLLSIYMYYN